MRIFKKPKLDQKSKNPIAFDFIEKRRKNIKNFQKFPKISKSDISKNDQKVKKMYKFNKIYFLVKNLTQKFLDPSDQKFLVLFNLNIN